MNSEKTSNLMQLLEFMHIFIIRFEYMYSCMRGQFMRLEICALRVVVHHHQRHVRDLQTGYLPPAGTAVPDHQHRLHSHRSPVAYHLCGHALVSCRPPPLRPVFACRRTATTSHCFVAPHRLGDHAYF
jgi:hypothetical protein